VAPALQRREAGTGGYPAVSNISSAEMHEAACTHSWLATHEVQACRYVAKFDASPSTIPPQAVPPPAGSSKHGEAADSPTSPTAHWAARAGGASQQDSDDGDATDGEYVDAAAASVGSPASPTAHWAQPHGAATEQQADDKHVLEEQCIERRWPSDRDQASNTDSDSDNNDDDDDGFDISADYDLVDDPGSTCSFYLQLAVRCALVLLIRF
jgi:hypothetical protein